MSPSRRRRSADSSRSPTLAEIRADIRRVADPERATAVAKYFKTGPGEYGAGDRFLGVTMPALRALSHAHQQAPRPLVTALLASPWHEERMLALLILIRQYGRATPAGRRAIASLYLRSRKYINNWDLVDCSASRILGAEWADDDGGQLTKLAASRRVWDRRIAVITTFHDIARGRFDRALTIAEGLIDDHHDLIHKAVGWMLRETGKRDRATLQRFLDRHAARMPRTMLRYAVERFPVALRRRYLGSARRPR